MHLAVHGAGRVLLGALADSYNLVIGCWKSRRSPFDTLRANGSVLKITYKNRSCWACRSMNAT